jgi:hypothetical protein
MSKSFVVRPLLAACTAGILFGSSLPILAGQKIRVYDVPKETTAHATQPATGEADPHAGVAMGMPKLKWARLPEGWKENPAPGSMRAASFIIAGANETEAELAVIPMSGMENIESQLVNMWRGQVKIAPLSEEEMAKQGAEISIGTSKGRLFEMASTEPILGGNFKARFLVAMLKEAETTWFFKLAGEDALVAGQKAAFVEFLKGVSFEAPQMPAGHPPMADAKPAGGMGQGMMGGGMQGGDTVKAGTGPHPEWQMPPGWLELDHSSFLVAKFRATGEAGAQADINVSTSAGTGGGLLPNVNRWRAQLSLGPVDQAVLDKLAATLELPTGKALVVDFSGADSENDNRARCIGVMVPLADQTWFYKLMGAEKVVAREKESLLNFVRSVKY